MEALGPYRILQAIGQGGMGTVWLAEHAQRHVAIKILRDEFSANYTVVHRFFNEARAASMVADPGIVQIFDCGQIDGRAFIVMELLQGEPLDVRLKRLGRLSAPDAVRLMYQVAASLHAVHATGIIHRDLKPENIFIVGDPSVTGGERTKLLDFGIAKLSDEQSTVKTRTGVVIGTPVYMSPEQCRGTSELDHRSDVYSFGCVLFTVLCGRPPFESQGSGDLIIKHVTEPVPAPSSFAPIPPSLESLVLRCLAKAPADRFQSMADVIAALAVVGNELATASGPRAWREPGTLPPPNRVTPSPTTLGASSGQVSSATIVETTAGAPAGTPKRRVGWIAGAVATVGIAAGGIYVFGFTGNTPSLDAPAARPGDSTTHVTAPIGELRPAAPEPAQPETKLEAPRPPATAPEPVETSAAKPAVVAPPKPVVAQPKPPVIVSPKPASPKPASPKPASPKPVPPKPPVKPAITDRGD